VIDPATRIKITDIPLEAYPQTFELAAASGRILVNMADARQIAVINRAGRQADHGVADASGGGKLSDVIDPDGDLVIVAFRRAGTTDGLGAITQFNLPSCGAADDVFVDAKRHRL
jgi:hypothetical protein